MSKKLFVLVFILSAFLVLPQKTSAYSPIIASCNSNLTSSNAYYDVMADQVMQLFEARDDTLMLDAVTARLAAPQGAANATAVVIKRDQGQISSVQAEVSQNPSWVYFDMPNAALPRGVYYLYVYSVPPADVTWNYTNYSECLVDSYVRKNGVNDFNKDMGFGIYAFHENQPDPDGSTSSDPDQNPDSSSQSQNNSQTQSGSTGSDQIPGTSGSTSSSPKTSQNGTSLSDEEILKMANNKDKSGSGWSGIIPGLFMLGPIASIFISIFGFLLFVGFIVLIIVLATRKSKKKEDLKKNEPENSPEKDKPVESKP